MLIWSKIFQTNFEDKVSKKIPTVTKEPDHNELSEKLLYAELNFWPSWKLSSLYSGKEIDKNSKNIKNNIATKKIGETVSLGFLKYVLSNKKFLTEIPKLRPKKILVNIYARTGNRMKDKYLTISFKELWLLSEYTPRIPGSIYVNLI